MSRKLSRRAGVGACDWGSGVSELVTIAMFASWRSDLGLGSEHPRCASMSAIGLAIVTIVRHAHQAPSELGRAPCVIEGS
jgi:hypothetical protein